MIGVVGGGITGLALGRELHRRGAEFRVLEASGRPGGVIRSGRVDGRLLEWGPQRTRRTTEMADLVRELGLEDEVVTSPGELDLFVYRGGRLRRVPYGVREFLTSDVVSLRGRLRLLLEPLTRGPDPDERVSTYFERKFGREIYETLIAPLYGGLYGSDPAEMEVGVSLHRMLERSGAGRSLILHLLRRQGGRITPPPALSFRDGMETLPRAMAADLGDAFLPETPVERLERSKSGWRLHLADGGAMEAGQVVLATSAPATARLLEPHAPETARFVSGLRSNPLTVVHLESEAGLEGMGFQVAFTEREFTLRGVTFNEALFGRAGVYTAFLGGARNREVEALDLEAAGRSAVEQFRATTGAEARVIHAEKVRMPAWDLSWRGIDRIAVPEGIHLAGGWHARPGLPGRFTEAKQIAARIAPTDPRALLHPGTAASMRSASDRVRQSA